MEPGHKLLVLVGPPALANCQSRWRLGARRTRDKRFNPGARTSGAGGSIPHHRVGLAETCSLSRARMGRRPAGGLLPGGRACCQDGLARRVLAATALLSRLTAAIYCGGRTNLRFGARVGLRVALQSRVAVHPRPRAHHAAEDRTRTNRTAVRTCRARSERANRKERDQFGQSIVPHHQSLRGNRSPLPFSGDIP